MPTSEVGSISQNGMEHRAISWNGHAHTQNGQVMIAEHTKIVIPHCEVMYPKLYKKSLLLTYIIINFPMFSLTIVLPFNSNISLVCNEFE